MRSFTNLWFLFCREKKNRDIWFLQYLNKTINQRNKKQHNKSIRNLGFGNMEKGNKNGNSITSIEPNALCRWRIPNSDFMIHQKHRNRLQKTSCKQAHIDDIMITVCMNLRKKSWVNATEFMAAKQTAWD